MSSPFKAEFGRVVRAVIAGVTVRQATVSGVVYETCTGKTVFMFDM
jgi:hypothetical protein